MRLDKFLQLSRLIKRRTMANRLCDAGRVTLNGHRAKPAAEVEVGDLIGVNFGSRQIVARVLRIPGGRPTPAPIVEIVQDRRVPDAW
jgi:ribosomal 50S subunit-recycling heat shock protein